MKYFEPNPNCVLQRFLWFTPFSPHLWWPSWSVRPLPTAQRVWNLLFFPVLRDRGVRRQALRSNRRGFILSDDQRLYSGTNKSNDATWHKCCSDLCIYIYMQVFVIQEIIRLCSNNTSKNPFLNLISKGREINGLSTFPNMDQLSINTISILAETTCKLRRHLHRATNRLLTANRKEP